MLTFLSAEFGRYGTIRRYQHPALGILKVVTMRGESGSADVVLLHGAVSQGIDRRAHARANDVRRRGKPKPRQPIPQFEVLPPDPQPAA